MFIALTKIKFKIGGFMSLKTTESTFENDVLKSDVPVLVDFWAPWCGPCKMLGPIIDSVSQKIEGKAKVYKLNIDENPQIANKYGVTSIPTVIIYNQGEVSHELVGVRPEQEYLNTI